MDQYKPKTALNLDTNFLKLIAIIAMAIDHTYRVFFPDSIWMAIIGRIAFPLFAYCLVVGCLYTRNVCRYILRLALFALISQPIYVLESHPTWTGFQENILSLNIFFTLVAGVMVVCALMNLRKRWWLLLIAIAMEFLLGLDYGLYGLVMMALLYIFRNKRWLAMLTVAAWMCTMIRGDFFHVMGFGVDKQLFALLALPFIGIHTNFEPKIHKYFFYLFYPAHLLVIFLIRLIMDV